MPPVAEVLIDALDRAPPRATQVLLQAAARGEQLASFYGINADAARELEAEALAAVAPGLAGRLPLARVVPELRGALAEVRAGLAAREDQRAQGPDAARWNLLRRLAIAGILAATAWSYLTRR